MIFSQEVCGQRWLRSCRTELGASLRTSIQARGMRDREKGIYRLTVGVPSLVLEEDAIWCW